MSDNDRGSASSPYFSLYDSGLDNVPKNLKGVLIATNLIEPCKVCGGFHPFGQTYEEIQRSKKAILAMIDRYNKENAHES